MLIIKIWKYFALSALTSDMEKAEVQILVRILQTNYDCIFLPGWYK